MLGAGTGLVAVTDLDASIRAVRDYRLLPRPPCWPTGVTDTSPSTAAPALP